MGARAACLAALSRTAGEIKTLILVSFPLTGAKKSDSREQILLDLPSTTDVLFISGSEDTMCDLDSLHDVATRMKARSWIIEVEGADHGMGLKPNAATQPVRVQTGRLAAEWLRGRDGERRFLNVRWEGGVTEDAWAPERPEREVVGEEESPDGMDAESDEAEEDSAPPDSGTPT